MSIESELGAMVDHLTRACNSYSDEIALLESAYQGLKAASQHATSLIPSHEMTHEEIKADRHILVDLDGTLARYDGWVSAEHIGEPIPAIVERVKRWTAQGMKVRIFTARAHAANRIPVIKKWLQEQGLGDLEVTCVKLPSAVEIWDDLAVQVTKNTGKATVQEAQDVYSEKCQELKDIIEKNAYIIAEQAKEVARLTEYARSIGEDKKRLADELEAMRLERNGFKTDVARLKDEVKALIGARATTRNVNAEARDELQKEIARLKSLVEEKEEECKLLHKVVQKANKDFPHEQEQRLTASAEAQKTAKRLTQERDAVIVQRDNAVAELKRLKNQIVAFVHGALELNTAIDSTQALNGADAAYAADMQK